MFLSKCILITFLVLISIFPLNILHFMGALLGYFLNLIPNRLRSTTITNLKLCFPDKTHNEINKLTRLSLVETSKTFFELGKCWIKYPKRGVDHLVQIEGLPSLKKSLQSSSGVILFSAHLGNIEIIINYLAKNFNCTIPYSKIKIPAAEAVIKKARESMGAKMVKASSSGVRSLLKSLNQGELVTIASDQVPNREGGIISNFFQVPALSMSLVVKLASKTNCLCHSVSCVRRKGGKGYKIYFSELINMSSNLEIQEGVNLMNSELEKCIMRAPEQYAWEYKRFKASTFENPY